MLPAVEILELWNIVVLIPVRKKKYLKWGPLKMEPIISENFLALVHALALMKKNNDKRPIYTDSRTGLSWLK